ncbi:hypothetical protein DFH08DRAFT_626633, partial [Mycena albidolilacea]
PVPVELTGDLTVDSVTNIRKALRGACEKWLGDLTSQYSSRLPLIHGRLERHEDGNFVQMPVKLRHYLRVPVPAHRKALTRLYLSAHRLSVERLCRFCLSAVETKSHTLLGCMAKPELVLLRRDFL